MTEKFKLILKASLIFLSSGIYFALAYIGINKQSLDLNTFSTQTGRIENLGIDYRIGSKGRRSMVFFIDFEGLDQRLGIYRMNKNYNDLYKILRLGEIVTVYFEAHKSKENINIDLVQIEKDGSIILSKLEYEKKESALVWIGLFFGILTVVISWIYYKRNIGALSK